MNFDGPSNRQIRNSVAVGYEQPTLNREDSNEDSMWGNTDEEIGEYDRYIPVIGVPQCLTVLKDNHLPPKLQKMLRQSTRFSHSFHVNKDAEGGKRNSTIKGLKSKKKKQKRRDYDIRGSQHTEKRENKLSEFSAYKDINNNEKPIKGEIDDKQCNIAEDDWSRETLLKHHCDNLKKYSIDTIFGK